MKERQKERTPRASCKSANKYETWKERKKEGKKERKKEIPKQALSLYIEKENMTKVREIKTERKEPMKEGTKTSMKKERKK